MAGENNITQIYNNSKELLLPKSAEFISETNVSFEFDVATRGNALIAKGGYTEEFSIPASGAGTMPDDSNLVLYYKFDESTGVTCDDVKGTYDGTLVNGPGDDSQWVTGQTNNGLNLRGAATDDYIDVGDPLLALHQASYSISCWVKMTDGQVSGGQFIYGVADSDNDNVRIQIAQTGKMTLKYAIDLGVTSGAELGTNDVIFANGAAASFVHVVGVFDSTGVIKLYIDKVLMDDDGVNTGDMSTETMGDFAGTYDVYVGAFNGAGTDYNHFAGDIDEFRIYNIALTQDQITALYNNDI